MGKRKDPNQKGSGAKKHRRNYRLRHDGKYAIMGTLSKYRNRHGIGPGPRKTLHKNGECPVHKKNESRQGVSTPQA